MADVEVYIDLDGSLRPVGLLTRHASRREETVTFEYDSVTVPGGLRRIDRGLYDRPKINSLTKKATAPDYRAVIDAIARRDQLRLMVDGMTAANDLGLTDAVPAMDHDPYGCASPVHPTR